jgi:hypothetical protein
MDTQGALSSLEAIYNGLSEIAENLESFKRESFH